MSRTPRVPIAALALAALVAGAASAGSAITADPAPAARAEEQPLPRIEFDAAVAQAIEKNPTVAQAATQISRAEGLLRQARAAILPNVSGSVANITLDKGVAFGGTTVQPRNQTVASLYASVPVLAPAEWAAVTQARDQVEVARLSTEEARRQIATAAAQAYLGVIAARRQLEVGQRALESGRAHLDYAQQRLDTGAGKRLDQLRAAQVVSTDQARIEAAQLALRRTQEALGVLLAADGPVDAGAEPALAAEVAPDLEQAIAGRADIRRQRAVVSAAKRTLADSWKDLMPTGLLAAKPQYVHPVGAFQREKSWSLTLSLAIPIYSGGEQGALEAQRASTAALEELTLTALEIAARSEVRLAEEAIASNDRALTSARLAAEQASEVLRITTAAFGLGATTNLEVIDAERTARDAETAAAQAEDALRQARLQLLVALGRFPG